MKQNKIKRIITIIIVLACVIIYNLPPVIVTSEGILYGKRQTGDKMQMEKLTEQIVNEPRYPKANRFDNFYFVYFGVFKKVEIRQEFIKDQPAIMKNTPFSYKIKVIDRKSSMTIFHVRYGSNVYVFRYIVMI